MIAKTDPNDYSNGCFPAPFPTGSCSASVRDAAHSRCIVSRVPDSLIRAISPAAFMTGVQGKAPPPFF